ncbi:MAG: TIGR02300 family protein [Alphaproteobacteria bacterium]
MSKQEWGAKHLCPGCGAKFYDMGRNPIACPSCDEPAAIAPPRHSRRSRKDGVKEEPSLPSNKKVGSAEDGEGVISGEVNELIDDDDAIANLADDSDDDDEDVLAEADIDTTKIGEE